MHEFMHAFGLTHEHERPDRDDYVTINKHNIRNYKYYSQFGKERSGSYKTFGVRYDGLSIMHYRATEFSISKYLPLYTIESKIPGIPTEKLGSSTDLTSSDILKLKRMYKCKY